MKRKYKIILSASVCAFFCLAAFIYFWRPVPFETSQAVVEDLTDKITVSGKLVPEETHTILAPVAGCVRTLPVIGAALAKGQEAAGIDDEQARRQLKDQITALELQQSQLRAEQLIQREQLDAKLQAARLDYERMYGAGNTVSADQAAAQAAYDQAAANYSNGQVLKENGFLSSQDLGILYTQMTAAAQVLASANVAASEETRSYYENIICSLELQLSSLENGDGTSPTPAMEAAAASLQLSIDEINRSLNSSSLDSPYDSVVWELLVQDGSYVVENQPLLTVYPDGQLKIQVSLLAQDTTGIAEGMGVTCTLFDGRTFPASVSFLSAVAKEQASSVGLTENRCLVELTADAIPPDLGAGFPVDVTFAPVLAEQALTVPLASLVPMEGGDGVYVLRGRKKVLTPVETGVKANGRVQILSGLAKGDTVVLH